MTTLIKTACRASFDAPGGAALGYNAVSLTRSTSGYLPMQPGGKFTIGRDQACDIPIADDSVSRHHAELTLLDHGKLLLVDCQSSNGTAVLEDGRPRPIRQAFVTPSDQVQLGSVVLSVSDLLAAIDAKAAHRPRPAVAQPAPDRLVRCECGVIKPANSKCPECGQ